MPPLEIVLLALAGVYAAYMIGVPSIASARERRSEKRAPLTDEQADKRLRRGLRLSKIADGVASKRGRFTLFAVIVLVVPVVATLILSSLTSASLYLLFFVTIGCSVGLSAVTWMVFGPILCGALAEWTLAGLSEAEWRGAAGRQGVVTPLAPASPRDL